MVDFSSLARYTPYITPNYGAQPSGILGPDGGWGSSGIFGSGDIPMPGTNMSGALPNFGSGNVTPFRVGDPKLGLNFDTANLALSGIGTIGSLWAAFKAQSLARDQFNYTKKITDTNLANQIQTYNAALTDRANNRAIVEGNSPEKTQAYILANSLKKYGG